MTHRPTRPLDRLLEEAQAVVERLDPAAALAAAEAGALVVDIRSESARERDGVVPGAIHIPRTVLEWRLEPGGEWRNPHIGGPERQVILICDHGYSSLLAAAGLNRLGRTSVCDVVGGFAAWRAAGLPIGMAPRESGGGLPGMAEPD